MHINTIKATNIELTDAIRDYVHEKFGTLEKLTAEFDDAANLSVSCDKASGGASSFKCEATLEVPGKVLRVSKESSDLYKSIGKTVDHLWRSLKEYKDLNYNNGKKASRASKE